MKRNFNFTYDENVSILFKRNTFLVNLLACPPRARNLRRLRRSGARFEFFADFLLELRRGSLNFLCSEFSTKSTGAMGTQPAYHTCPARSWIYVHKRYHISTKSHTFHINQARRPEWAAFPFFLWLFPSSNIINIFTLSNAAIHHQIPRVSVGATGRTLRKSERSRQVMPDSWKKLSSCSLHV